MAALTALIPVHKGTPIPNITNSRTRAKHPKAYLAADHGVKLQLPFAPRETELGGWADQWTPLDRPGRRPVVRRDGDGLATLSFNALLGFQGHQTNIEPMVGRLRSIAESGARIIIEGMSPQERGPWRLTDVTLSVEQRKHGSNVITRATASLSFIAAVDARPRIGVNPPKKPPKKAAKPRHYTIRKGDTMRKISQKFYHTPKYWKVIAKRNHIVHVNRPRVGKRIVIPPKPKG